MLSLDFGQENYPHPHLPDLGFLVHFFEEKTLEPNTPIIFSLVSTLLATPTVVAYSTHTYFW